MRFLFWNICKNNIFKEIASLVIIKDIDVLLIAEFPTNIDPKELRNELLCRGVRFDYISPYSPKDKVRVYTRFRKSLITNIQDESGVSAKSIYSPILKNKVILITCHLPSKISKSDMNQSELSSDVRDFILRVENRFNHQYTVVCGDFNMNPFDEGLIKAKGFHAIMNKKIALKGKRKINDKDYSFFYNPMWGFLGNGVVSGTMYYNSSDHINYFWHMYDQVLLRPELIPFFDDKELEIVTNIGSENLLSDIGIVNKKYSDHLPILFTLKI